jgi:hypothetical protein
MSVSYFVRYDIAVRERAEAREVTHQAMRTEEVWP